VNALLAALLLASQPAAKPSTAVPLPPPPVTTRPDLTPPPPQRLPAGAPGAARGGLRVAVLDTRVTGEVPARALAVFDQSIVPEVRKLEGVSAIGMAEIRDMLGFEYQRQMLGCQADDACLAEIAGSLGVDELVTPSLVLTGKRYALSIRRLDLRKAKVIQSFDRTLEQRDGEELLAIVGPAVAAVFPERGLRAGKARGVEAAVIRRLNPPPLAPWVTWTTAGAAVAALGGAGVSHALARGARDEYDRLVKGALTVAIPASELEAAADRVHGRESTRNLLLFTGLGLGVAAGVEALFTDWKGDRRAVQAGPRAVAIPYAAPGEGGLAIAGRF